MKIDFNAMLCGEQRELTFSYALDIGGYTPDIASGNAKIIGNAFDHTGYIKLQIEFMLDMAVVCSKCAEEFNYKDNFKIEYSLCTALENPEENDDYIVLDSGMLDLEELAETSIILNLPSRFICKKNCKGLCQKCGANLNNGRCDCPDKEIDPRLVKLIEYLEKFENNDTEEVE
ncbi:MAG: hypothetical protein A2Y17_04610 [Clostridiales bacterium GWF2_38_85]|nr:MAG: hypothetical protein A2Y17_04610 [Clostridiales bacterium GWF2_38_85]HBL84431.1 DNA-binding protein [Clostridiales bacterium]